MARMASMMIAWIPMSTISPDRCIAIMWGVGIGVTTVMGGTEDVEGIVGTEAVAATVDAATDEAFHGRHYITSLGSYKWCRLCRSKDPTSCSQRLAFLHGIGVVGLGDMSYGSALQHLVTWCL